MKSSFHLDIDNRVEETQYFDTQKHDLSDEVENLVIEYTRLWWSCDGTLPVMEQHYTSREQAENARKLSRWIDRLDNALSHIPQNPVGRSDWQEQLRSGIRQYATSVLPLEKRHLDFIEESGLLDASQKFARMARVFDPSISGDDIYQAGRNIMTANFIQILLGLPVEVTPAVFAYSMLYPYTDNYLDDKTVSAETKHSFNQRFARRLAGASVPFENEAEHSIGRLVEMIEEQWERVRYPLVYQSLLAIHSAQERSLTLVQNGASPYERDVLGISFEKGGTSVLADGYLVAGSLTPDQIRCTFGYGAFTQLMDDLEDIRLDLDEGRMTVFTQTITGWKLDAVTNRLFHFGRAILGNLDAFGSPAKAMLEEVIRLCIDPILLDIVGRMGAYFSKEYLARMVSGFPYRYNDILKQRKKLNRRKLTIERLVQTLGLQT